MIKKIGFVDSMFYLFMILYFGLGYYYGDMYRVGGLFAFVFPAAIVLLFCLVKSGSRIDKNVFILIAIVFAELLLGCFNNYHTILKDLQVVIAFLAPYWYCKLKKDDEYFVKGVCVVYVLVGVVSLILNWAMFFQIGARSLSAGVIDRTFGIGLTFQVAATFSLFLYAYKEQFCQKYGLFIYLALHLFFIVSIAVSFTRTVWISYILEHIFLRLLLRKNKKISYKQMIYTTATLIFIIALVFGVFKLYEAGNPYVASIINRFTTLTDGSAINDEDSTLLARFADVFVNADKYKSPRIIIGYGLGDNLLNRNGIYGEGAENSFLYYSTRYGLVFCTILLYRIICVVVRKYRSESVGDKVLLVMLVWGLIIGGMSGMPNKATSIAGPALYISLNLGLIDGKRKGQE